MLEHWQSWHHHHRQVVAVAAVAEGLVDFVVEEKLSSMLLLLSQVAMEAEELAAEGTTVRAQSPVCCSSQSEQIDPAVQL